jgi:peptide chain release factor 1
VIIQIDNSVKVLPLSEETGQGETEELFDMRDVRIEVMRSRGAGGQVRFHTLA